MDLSSFDEDFLDYKLVGNITLFINCIICLSYPLNFAIYCGMSRSVLCHNPLSDILNCCRQFRPTFRALFLNPIQGWCAGCRQGPGEPIPDQETTTAMGTKSRSHPLKSSFYIVVIIQKSQRCLNRFRNDLLSPSLIGPFSKFFFTYLSKLS